MQLSITTIGALALAASNAAANVLTIDTPLLDRWMYAFNATPGERITASTFGAFDEPQFDNRDGQLIVAFDTTEVLLPAQGTYDLASVTLRLTVGNDLIAVYDDTVDPYTAFLPDTDPEYVADRDAGQPIELFGTGYRNGLNAFAFTEASPYTFGSPLVQQSRNAYALGYDGDTPVDVSLSVDERWTPEPFAVGTIAGLAPGALMPAGSILELDLDLANPNVRSYVEAGLNVGRISFCVTSLTQVVEGGGPFPAFMTKEHPDVLFEIADAPTLEIVTNRLCPGDVNGSGTVDFNDVLSALTSWGACAGCDGDVNGDNVVDFQDILLMLTNWGPC